MVISSLFFVYFLSFLKANNIIFTTINVKNCPSSIWFWDLNPRLLVHDQCDQMLK